MNLVFYALVRESFNMRINSNSPLVLLYEHDSILNLNTYFIKCDLNHDEYFLNRIGGEEKINKICSYHISHNRKMALLKRLVKDTCFSPFYVIKIFTIKDWKNFNMNDTLILGDV